MSVTSTPIPVIVRKSLGWSIGLSVLMIVAGILAIVIPPAAGIAVTVLFGWLFVFSGLAHWVFGWQTRSTGGLLWELLLGAPGSGWLFVDAIITLVLAIIIWRTWPANAGWVLGILVGFSMLFSGVSRLMLSLAARRLASELA